MKRLENADHPKVVIALGGNALEDHDHNALPTASSQLEIAKKTSDLLADIAASGYEMIIVHGNGPQVGRILIASETAKNITPPMPFDVCGAMSQGYIGYHIQQTLKYALEKRGVEKPVVTLITQTIVDIQDPAFKDPSKPIGIFYTKEDADRLSLKNGFVMKEDSERGYRRVVPSPKPVGFVEIEAIRALWHTAVVVAAGGGGVPVVKCGDGIFEGVSAVIDKDHAAEKLAEDLDADILLILTEVDKVSINFHKPDHYELDLVSADKAREYLSEGHFAAGSMLPKMEAAIRFAESKKGRKAIITSLYSACDALDGNAGTIVSG